MTQSNTQFVHRASERVSAGAAAVALTFLTLLTVDARADEAATQAPSVTVSYSDVAFGTPEGAAKVYRQLKSAARKVCGMDEFSRTLELQVAARQCYTETLAEAVRKVDRPMLTSLHAARTRTVG